MALLLARTIIAAWAIGFACWAIARDGVDGSRPRDWAVSLPVWSFVATLAYFTMTAYFTAADWTRSDQVPQMTAARKAAVLLHEVAFSLTAVIFFAHVLALPGLAEARLARYYREIHTVRALLEAHTRLAPFAWFVLDTALGASEFRHTHVPWVLSVVIVNMGVSGLDRNIRGWAVPKSAWVGVVPPDTMSHNDDDFGSRRAGWEAFEWCVLLASVMLAFYVGLCTTELKYATLAWFEGYKGNDDDVEQAKRMNESDHETDPLLWGQRVATGRGWLRAPAWGKPAWGTGASVGLGGVEKHKVVRYDDAKSDDIIRDKPHVGDTWRGAGDEVIYTGARGVAIGSPHGDWMALDAGSLDESAAYLSPYLANHYGENAGSF